jgi:hypothetical protein
VTDPESYRAGLIARLLDEDLLFKDEETVLVPLCREAAAAIRDMPVPDGERAEVELVARTICKTAGRNPDEMTGPSECDVPLWKLETVYAEDILAALRAARRL